jgi:uncharacterized protein (TIGR03435 family)
MRVSSRAGRYEIRNATMVDLIRTAYTVNPENVLGGPSWLEYDRFDVAALVPPNTTPDTQRLMLQALLADRFKLALRRDTKPAAGHVLVMGKGKHKLKEVDRLRGSSRLPDPACPCAAAVGRSRTNRAADDEPRLSQRHDGHVCGRLEAVDERVRDQCRAEPDRPHGFLGLRVAIHAAGH